MYHPCVKRAGGVGWNPPSEDVRRFCWAVLCPEWHQLLCLLAAHRLAVFAEQQCCCCFLQPQALLRGLLPAMQPIPVSCVSKGCNQVSAGRELGRKGMWIFVFVAVTCWEPAADNEAAAEGQQTGGQGTLEKVLEGPAIPHMVLHRQQEKGRVCCAWDVRVWEKQTHLEWCTNTPRQSSLQTVSNHPSLRVYKEIIELHTRARWELNSMVWRKGQAGMGTAGTALLPGGSRSPQHIPKSPQAAPTNWFSNHPCLTRTQHLWNNFLPVSLPVTI